VSSPEATSSALSGSRAPSQPEWVILPRNPSVIARAHEIWTSRHLFQYFAARLIQRRVRSSWIRTLRFVMRPVVPVVTYTLVFNRVAGIEAGTTPYFLFILSGLSVWGLLHESLLYSTRSFQMNGSLLRKLYFPRILLPASALSLAVLDLALHIVLLTAACLYLLVTTGNIYVIIGPNLLLAVLAVILCLYLGLALGLYLSVIGAGTPDLRFTLPYVMNLWMLVTPVLYPLSQIPQEFRWIAVINPMTPIVELFKAGLFGNAHESIAVTPLDVIRAFVMITVGFAVGLWYFGKAEASSVDRL
jgi:lipopolysaccharide transport system permease protein